MVFSSVPSSAAICLFNMPVITSCITSNSRGVNESRRRRPAALSAPSRRCSAERASALGTLQQFFVPKRLWKKIHCASLHRLRTHGDVPVAGDEDKLFLSAPLNQSGLQIHSVEPRHPHIDDQAGRSRVLFAREKISSRAKRFIFVAGRA